MSKRKLTEDGFPAIENLWEPVESDSENEDTVDSETESEATATIPERPPEESLRVASERHSAKTPPSPAIDADETEPPPLQLPKSVAKDFADARARLTELEKQKIADQKEEERRALLFDPLHPDDRRVRRNGERGKMVSRATDGTMLCPDCRRKVEDPRSWILWYRRSTPEDRFSVLVCHRCAARRRRQARDGEERLFFKFKIFDQSLVKIGGKFLISSAEIALRRKSKGLSIRSCAEECGWSPSMQQHIERGDENGNYVVRPERLEILRRVLGEDLRAVEEKTGEVLALKIRFEEFRHVRNEIGMSRAHVAAIFGMSVANLDYVISGKRTINEEKARLLLEELQALFVSTMDSLPSFPTFGSTGEPGGSLVRVVDLDEPRQQVFVPVKSSSPSLPRHVRLPEDAAAFPEHLKKKKDSPKTDP